MSISGGFLALPMEGDPKSEGTDEDADAAALWVRAPEGGFGFCTTVTWLMVSGCDRISRVLGTKG